MRASRWIAGLAAALWMVAVLAHYLFVSHPALWHPASQAYRILQTLDTAPGRCRIILIGSSPVIFGLSAESLQQGTGCNTVNAGQVAIGHVLNTYLDLVLQQVRPGDLVILSDRQWTQVAVKPRPCEARWSWPCMVSAVRLVPNLKEDVIWLRGLGLRRTAQGDLVDFPPMEPQVKIEQGLEMNDVAYRMARILQQVQAIRARGAKPLLVPAPMLVSEQARPALEAQLAQLSNQVQQALGPGVWLAPRLDTEIHYATLDGQHPSEVGRLRWTRQVQDALAPGLRQYNSAN